MSTEWWGKRQSVILAVLAVSVLTSAVILWQRNPLRGLPFEPDFSVGGTEQWNAYAGAWDTVGGSVRNDSDDRGAKLITGSRYWRDYTIDADVELLGPGDAGLIARARDAETGVDAYSGFYAGLRTMDGSLVLGRAEHGWYEFPTHPMPGGVHPFRWYHLRLQVLGCEISASATSYDSGYRTTATRRMRDCPARGAIGLRSYYSGGVWRNLTVRPASTARTPPELLAASLPRPDAGVSRHSLMADYIASGTDVPEPHTVEGPAVQSIASLHYESQLSTDRRAIRGLVVITSPVTCVQDSSAGICFGPATPSLKIGDEVEVIGVVRTRQFETVLENALVRLLWQANAAPPLSVTANQAASGAFAGMFVQLDGVLTTKSTNEQGTAVLSIDSGSQSFRALFAPGRITSRLDKLRAGTRVRLRGVCSVASGFTGNRTPFALLVRSADDLQVVAGPPWWSLSRLVPFAIAALIGLAIAGQVYAFAKHWRLRAVLEERARLAHEIHDTLAQSFAGIGYQLRAVRRSLPPGDPHLQAQLDLACDMVRHSHQEAKRSIASLRPETLEGVSLEHALKDAAKRMTQGGPASIQSFSTGMAMAMPLRIKDTLFRIGQEAIANAIRHSDAKQIEISVHYGVSSVDLSVHDNGKGFDTSTPQPGFGLIGIGKRAASISASLGLESFPGLGTTITVTAPIPAPVRLRNWPRYLVVFYKTYHGSLETNPTFDRR